jgi:hypothetical protein
MCNLLTFTRVKNGKHVSCAGIEWRFRNTQEETGCNQSSKVLYQRCTSRHYSPDQHPATHVDSRLDARDQHIRGHLHQHIADEEDADTGVELDTTHSQILF